MAAPNETSLYYGPYLKFQDVDLNTRTWLGSVLVITDNSLHPPEIRTWVDNVVHESASKALSRRCIWENNKYQAWRFDIEVLMRDKGELPVCYQLEITGPSNYGGHDTLVERQTFTFYVPGFWDPWRFIFYSCDGYDNSVKPSKRRKYESIGSLWEQVMDVYHLKAKEKKLQRERHHRRLDSGMASIADSGFYSVDEFIDFEPWHAQIGGGDQIYSDILFDQVPLLTNWIKEMRVKPEATETPPLDQLEVQLSDFFFKLYIERYGRTFYRKAAATIPQVNILDDHDIFDGYGSYQTSFRENPVVKLIGSVATEYYLLFQHHATDEIAREEDNYFGIDGYNYLIHFGPRMAVLGIDNRLERTRHQIVRPETYEMMFERIMDLSPTVRHLIVLPPVPVAFPDLPLMEKSMIKVTNVLCRKQWFRKFMDRSGLYKRANFLFAGNMELLDDLIDHWSSQYHIEEKNFFVGTILQNAALNKGLRITMLSGDVHCCGFARYRSDSQVIREEQVTSGTDHRLMYQVISSAITNLPPPSSVVWYFNHAAKKSNKILKKKSKKGEKESVYQDISPKDTIEEYLDTFEKNGRRKKLKCFTRSRNWCSVEMDNETDELDITLHLEGEKHKEYQIVVPPLNL